MSTNDPTGAQGAGRDDHIPPSNDRPGTGGTWQQADPSAGGAWQQADPSAGGAWQQSGPGGSPTGQGPGGWQQPAWGAPTPPPGAGRNGFFESLRRSGWFRADRRVLGGVCSGIAARTGWDVGLVRAVTVVLGIFLGPVWVAYGVAWALLPEQRDGRIHLEQLTRGHYDVAQLGALVMVLIGLGNFYPWFLPDGSGWFLWTLALIAAITIIVVTTTTGSRRQPGPQDTGGPGTWGAGPYGPGAPQGAAGTPGAFGSGPTQQPRASSQAWHGSPAPTGGQTGSAPQDGVGPQAGPVSSEANTRNAGVTPQGAAGNTGWQSAPGQQGGTGWQEGTGWQGSTPWQPEPTTRATAAAGTGWGPSSTNSDPRAPYATQDGAQFGAQSYSPGTAFPPPAPTPQPAWTAPAPSPAPRRLRAGTNLAVLGVIVLLVAASLYFSFVGTVSEMREFEPIAIGCGTGLIVVGLVMAWAAIRDRGAGWMIALSLVGVMIALPLMAILPWSHEQYVAADPDPVQISSSAEYDWRTDSVSGIGDIDLDLTGAPATTDKTITVDGSIGSLTVHVRQDQSVAFHIEGSTGTLHGEYYTDADSGMTSDPWVPEVDYITNSLSFRSDGWDPDAGITVAISGSIGDITIVEDAPASAAPSDSDGQSDSTQSGAVATPTPTTSTPSGSPSGEPTD